MLVGEYGMVLDSCFEGGFEEWFRTGEPELRTRRGTSELQAGTARVESWSQLRSFHRKNLVRGLYRCGDPYGRCTEVEDPSQLTAHVVRGGIQPLNMLWWTHPIC